jgi:cell division protein FtsW (lipid II flippase)
VRARGGARAWIDLGPIDLQPSEFMKPALVLLLASYLRFRKNHRTLRGLLPPAIMTGVPMALIMLQPDLGTAILFIPALFFVLVAAGAKLKHLALVVVAACLFAPLAYPMLKPHQKQRIAGLIMQAKGDQSADQDINMQSVTAQRMIGAGQVLGTSETTTRVLHRYNALPERHNDMIFAVVCTRFGFLGGLALITTFVAWILFAFVVAARCTEPMGRLLIVGCCGFLAAQVVINLGMNLGLLPIIGITLPFVSQGGSSMLAQWVMTGMVFAVALRHPRYAFGRNLEWRDNDT